MTKLLIDADLYLFRACAAAEEETDWGDDIWSLWTDLGDAKEVFNNTINEITTTLNSTDLVLCLSDKNNFRFLHISTDEVFGELGESGFFKESTSYNPNSPYSASKASSDHFVRAWSNTFGLPAMISN